MISKNEAYFTTATKTVLTPFFFGFDCQKQTKGRRIKIVKLTKMAKVVKQQNIN